MKERINLFRKAWRQNFIAGSIITLIELLIVIAGSVSPLGWNATWHGTKFKANGDPDYHKGFQCFQGKSHI